MILDAATIAALYRSHGHVVLRRARTMLGRDAEAWEVLQDVFAALVRAPDAVRSEDSLVGWLYQATTHACLKELRRTRTQGRLLAEHVVPLRPAPPAPLAEASAELRRVLALLPDDVAAAVVYHHLDGLTHTETAELLGCSRRQVGYLLERARSVLERTETSA